MESVWTKVKAALKERLPAHRFRMWIEPMKLMESQADTVVLACPNDFAKKRVQQLYGAMIEAEINRALGRDCKFIIEVPAETAGPNGRPSGQAPERAAPSGQLSLPGMDIRPNGGRMLRGQFTFDQFVVGRNNDFAYSAALSLASQPAACYDSLFLLSRTGMGKTHLSQAIGHYILARFPTERVYYITAEDFTNEMIQAFKNRTIERFKARYRNQCDVLLLEDIHFLTGKQHTQDELALTLDYLVDNQKRIIFTSHYLPAEIPKLSEALRSRLAGGLISKIEAPDFDTRVRILFKKAKENRYFIPREVGEYLADELTDNVRQLESGLLGVATRASLLGVPVDRGLAESVVQQIGRQQQTITIAAIKGLVSREYGVSVKDIDSRSRKQAIVRARQVAIYFARRYTDQSLQAIGRSFNRQHGTVLYSIGAVKRGVKENAPLRRQVEILDKKLDGGTF